MKSNRIMWLVVVLVVSATMAVTFGTLDSNGQENSACPQAQSTPTPPTNPFGDMNKYPTVDYDAPEVATAPEHEERLIKNKRYDRSFPVMKDPSPDDVAVGGIDEDTPVPPAIPFAESKLVVVGEIVSSKAVLSNEKKAIYSEYSLRIQTILKADKEKKLRVGETITMDREGGAVRYPSGQKILYFVTFQNTPEVNGRYLFFLTSDAADNPNYKIITAYQLKNGVVTALDTFADFGEFNGKSETDFIKLVLSKK